MQTFFRTVEKWVPDPFFLALFLSLITLLSAWWGLGVQPGVLAGAWYKGFWELLRFAMQMSLILITGYILAESALVQKVLGWITSIPKTPAQAVLMCGWVAGLTALLHWGLGMVTGAILARDMNRRLSRKGVCVHYPILAASGYIGLAVWHGGFSGSAPLLVSQAHHFLSEQIGTIPLSATIGTAVNIVTSLTAVLVLPLVLALLHPRHDIKAPRSEAMERPGTSAPSEDDGSPIRRFENLPLWGLLVGLAGIAVTVTTVHGRLMGNLDLNRVIALFLFTGMVLHSRLPRFLETFYRATKAAGPIILQFPFYGGIMGIMKYTGLADAMARSLVRWSTAGSLPEAAFLGAGLVNLFVPSGGGQWAVQGPVVVQAAAHMHVPFAKMVMAVAYGDQWTNLLQPFWALPLLSLTGLKARDIMGYCMVLLPVAGMIYGIGLWFM